MTCKVEGMVCGPVCSVPQEMVTTPPEERRRFPRVRVSLPVTFRLETGHSPLHGRGVLRDISLSGAYFFTEAALSPAPDLILELSILCHVPGLDQAHTDRLYARGRVVRLENSQAPQMTWGVAVTFLEGPAFPPPPGEPVKMFKK